MRTIGNCLGTGIVLVLLCFFSGGCARDQLAQNRDDSFLPYEQTRVGPTVLRGFLDACCSPLYRADGMIVTPSGGDFGTVSIRGNVFHLGVATAIDRRGYFLTASHCLAKGPFKVIVSYEGQIGGATARVVWRGDVSKGQPDLALLDAAIPLEHVFDWSPDFTNGESIVVLGLDVLAPHKVQKQCLGGKIVGVANGSETAMPQYQTIALDAPLLREDNGGPVADLSGRLIAINISSAKRIPAGSSGTAQRPDLAWLKHLIDEDAARPSAPKSH